ncbi:uncharacterized protein LOC143288116 [Babylonia areolata]|uniref:uncharacterized protein LOC143288116 n=1 Tax=Babylonia areolata TaxID=304850 RepID=UPI003FD0BB48
MKLIKRSLQESGPHSAGLARTEVFRTDPRPVICCKMRCLLLLMVTCVGVSLCCQGGKDCGDNECCVTTAHGNTCQPLASEEQQCVIMFGRFPFGKPEGPVKQCPCALGLTCITDDPKQSGLEGAQGTCQMLLLS